VQTRTVFRNTGEMQFKLRVGDLQGVDELIAANKAIIEQLISQSTDPRIREGNLASIIDKFTECRILHHFYKTGLVVPIEAVQPCSDDEYIGAVLGFAQELVRYCIGRGGERDTHTIDLCLRLLTALNGKMLEFSFRNGPLRRKFDSLKYAVRNVENIGFELSMTSCKASAFSSAAEDEENGDEQQNSRPPAKKRSKPSAAGEANTSKAVDVTSQDSSGQQVDLACLEAIRLRMEEADALREDVIKKSRDVQKQSKLAIYAVQRGDLKDAGDKLNIAKDLALLILKSVENVRIAATLKLKFIYSV
jgi:predicted translin family RNA/ssDNA-binding protein